MKRAIKPAMHITTAQISPQPTSLSIVHLHCAKEGGANPCSNFCDMLLTVIKTTNVAALLIRQRSNACGPSGFG
jgi:hypothetical protein